MARQLAEATHTKFDAGYVTEATALNYPPNAVTDTENCVFHFAGNLTRRKGFNYEVGGGILTFDNLGISPDEATISSFYWQNASGVGSVNLAVVQVGSIILFFQVGTTAALSAEYRQAFDLNVFAAIPGNPGVASQACQYAVGDGYLFIAHPYCDPLYVAYNADGTVSPNRITLRIRDFVGVPDIDPPTGIDQNVGNGISHRPRDLTNNHIYNLYNQGWFVKDTVIEYPTFLGNDGLPFDFPAVVWDNVFYIFSFKTNGMGVYPSNADVWWRFKDQGGAYNPVTTTANVQTGNTRAPQGFFILDAFNQDRSAAVVANHGTASFNDTPGLPVVTSGYFRPSTIAFFAGRAFYAGVQDPQFANYIYFSRIIEQPAQIGQCYQDDDPTASDLGVADLLASDGGYIKSPDFGVVYKIYAMASALLVFTSKGVWSIGGSTGFGFTASDYSVSKISSIPMINPQAFIDLDGTPVWWNDDGIYTLQGNQMALMQGTMNQQVKPITYSTIQKFFNTIPPESKAYSTGVYNRSEHTIYWLYSASAPVDVTTRYKYDSVLCQNTITGAFYKWTLPYNSQLDRYIAGALVIYGIGTDFIGLDVTASDGTIVTISTGDVVTINAYSTAYIGQVTKFIVLQTLGA